MVAKFTQLSGIVLMVTILHHYSICVSSSTSHQKSLHEYDYSSRKYSTSSTPCLTRYALDSFFKEYESFTDSNFLDYIVHKINVGSERRFARLLDLERHLIGEGSHRRLSSIIRISIQADLIDGYNSHICNFILIERLPSGVFADSFELQHLVRRGVFKDAAVFGDTNLELPSFLSNQSIVEVHLDAALNSSVGLEVLLQFKIEIPLHARYQPLEESGYSKVRFGTPDLFMYCKMHEKFPTQSCSFSPLISNDALGLDDIVWSIPAGIKAHSRMVSIVTFTSALLSATSIILASLRSSPMAYDGRLKQS